MSDCVVVRWVLDCQKPWAGYLVTGKKRVETRSYDLPKDLIGVPVLIMETHRGPYLFDKFVGVVVFSGSIAYESEEAWRNEQDLHLVDPKSETFGWRDGSKKFKWTVKSFARIIVKEPVMFETMDRYYRSVYRLKVPLDIRADLLNVASKL